MPAFMISSTSNRFSAIVVLEGGREGEGGGRRGGGGRGGGGRGGREKKVYISREGG